MNLEAVNMLALSLLVLVFASIVRRYSITQLQFWFLGWVLILVDYVIVLVTGWFPTRPTLLAALDVSAIEMAGMAFLVAVSTVCGDPERRKILAACLSVPLLIYTNAVMFDVRYKPLFLGLAVFSVVGTMYLVWSYYQKFTAYVITVMTLCVALCFGMVYMIMIGEFRGGVHLAQAGLFAMCGVLYIRRFPRPSVGVTTAVAGFFIWAFAFLLQGSNLLALASLHTAFSSFDVPKYVVAFGMILTLLEEQLQESERASEQMEYLAQHDPLTGLPNRLLLNDRLARALARAKRSEKNMAVLCIDIDRFKQTNDTFGHYVGDLCLKEISARFHERLRESDTLARSGGDEFTVIIEELTSIEDATKVANSLISTLQNPVQVSGCVLQMGASVGVAVYPHDGEDADLLRCSADHAMYRAKARGRNQFEMSSEDSRIMLDVEMTMRKALDTKGLELMYQPQVRPNGTIAGVEALLRLHHEKYGIISPAKFIPVAEETGLIIPIGKWVLNEACRQGVEWKKKYGTSPRIAINVSALQFARPDFAEEVEKALHRSGFPSSLLELELTESLVMSNVEESSRQMECLKRLGVRISVDDFGTGYSSLAYLHTLPIDTLKVDRSFVEKMMDTGGTRPIVETILALARGLGMTTVAEGVETNLQANLLEKLGCDVFQGFCFFRPMPALEIGVLLSKAEAPTFLPGDIAAAFPE